MEMKKILKEWRDNNPEAPADYEPDFGDLEIEIASDGCIPSECSCNYFSEVLCSLCRNRAPINPNYNFEIPFEF